MENALWWMVPPLEVGRAGDVFRRGKLLLDEARELVWRLLCVVPPALLMGDSDERAMMTRRSRSARPFARSVLCWKLVHVSLGLAV